MQVEDHPIDYKKIEGTIPAGEYGGDTVMVWDRGRWRPEGDPHRGLAKGHLSFRLAGKKLRGGWHLVRLRKRPGEKRSNWLLIKQRDEAARTAHSRDILREMPLSAKTDRSIEEIAQHKRKMKRKAKAERGTTKSKKLKLKRAKRR